MNQAYDIKKGNKEMRTLILSTDVNDYDTVATTTAIATIT